MKSILVLVILFILLACRPRTVTRSEIESKLKQTMTEYLYNSVKLDTSKVKYNVLDVIFYEDKNLYLCEFEVQMKLINRKDTIGKMKANITKDFKKVVRKS